MPKAPNPKCKACNGTGKTSKGNRMCIPCAGKGKLPVRICCKCRKRITGVSCCNHCGSWEYDQINP